MDNRTAAKIDISAILSLYAYLDNQDDAYRGLELKTILDSMPAPVKKSNDYIKIMEAVDANPRLQRMKLISQSMKEGFSEDLIIACAFQDPSDGNIYVAYRGTGDGKWVDNGIGIANKSSQMQEEAARYFDHVVEDIVLGSPGRGKLIVTGHSKGGNEAQYVTLNSEYGHMVDNCYSLDGQGFSLQAIAAFKARFEQYGKGAFEEQLKKMYSINGDNDYVHDLGIPVIPAENTYFIENAGDSFAGYHDLKEMIEGVSLRWKRSSDGVILKGEQGPIGKLALTLSKKMRTLSQDDLEDCALSVMSALEVLMQYEGLEDGGVPYGTGDRKFATAEEFIGFLAHGVPLVTRTMLFTPEGNAILSDLISQGLQTVYDKAGPMGVVGALFVGAIAVPIAATVLGSISLVAFILDTIGDFFRAVAKVVDDIKQWFSELKDAFVEVINRAKNWYDRHFNAGYKYATANPWVTLDTYKLRSYAQRLSNVNSRIVKLDLRLDGLYWQVGLLGLWNLIQADALTGYNWSITRCAAYLMETAGDFDSVESNLASSL